MKKIVIKMLIISLLLRVVIILPVNLKELIKGIKQENHTLVKKALAVGHNSINNKIYDPDDLKPNRARHILEIFTIHLKNSMHHGPYLPNYLSKNIRILQTLLLAGASPIEKNKNGKEPLEKIAQLISNQHRYDYLKGSSNYFIVDLEEIVVLFIKYGANVYKPCDKLINFETKQPCKNLNEFFGQFCHCPKASITQNVQTTLTLFNTIYSHSNVKPLHLFEKNQLPSLPHNDILLLSIKHHCHRIMYQNLRKVLFDITKYMHAAQKNENKRAGQIIIARTNLIRNIEYISYKLLPGKGLPLEILSHIACYFNYEYTEPHLVPICKMHYNHLDS